MNQRPNHSTTLGRVLLCQSPLSDYDFESFFPSTKRGTIYPSFLFNCHKHKVSLDFSYAKGSITKG